MARKRATREDLARVIGTADQPVHTETVARRLRGDIEFSARELAALADYFGVPVSTLLGEEARSA